jgi:hypothetical protein
MAFCGKIAGVAIGPRMSAWKSVIPLREAALSAALFCALPPATFAGHEVPYYPSFYPQEIRIEPLDPEAAAREFVSKTDPLHAYLGAGPRFTGQTPDHLKSVQSLKSLITVTVNPRSQRMQNREARCEAMQQAAVSLAKHPDVVAHPFPVTPFHADYIGYIDLVPPPKPVAAAPKDAPLTFRAGDAAQATLLPPETRVHATEWDLGFDEVSTDELRRIAGVASNNWPAPPWAKDGWFQAYHLLRPSIGEAGNRERADAIYDRRTHGEFRDQTERVSLERDLLAALRSGCERAVVGYRLRRDFYNDDFSNGIEHIFVDSQTGFNSPVFLRVVKLKDFPWNGWLRLGIAARPQAAWNPVAGFTDAPGRLIWATTADDAFLPIPHDSRWTPNRAEIRQDDEASARQSVRIPSDALVPQSGSGKLGEVGSGKGANTKVIYRVSASSFHDDTVMEPADLFYPYALAFRWGAGKGNGAVHDPEIAAATRLIRERLRGVRIVRIEESTIPIADLTFTYRSPIVEVYLDNLTLDDQENGLIAPPWSSMPWHVLALMEAAVERGIAAFSESEAKRRGLPWLDLVRDPGQMTKLRALIKEFAQIGYRPAALEMLVGPEDAKARWDLLDKFVEASGHLLVTNGPYRLAKWSPDAFVFNVVREFTYPIGLGTFNSFAYPPRAWITGIEQEGNRILIAADAEFALKEQRDRRLVRMPLRRDTLRDTLPIHPTPQYVVIGADGRVAAAGNAVRQPDERFAVTLPAALPAGAYTLFTAIFLDGNTISPDIGRISFRSK